MHSHIFAWHLAQIRREIDQDVAAIRSKGVTAVLLSHRRRAQRHIDRLQRLVDFAELEIPMSNEILFPPRDLRHPTQPAQLGDVLHIPDDYPDPRWRGMVVTVTNLGGETS